MPIINLGSGIAYSLFSSSDWKLNEKTMKRLEKDNLANEREYFLDTELSRLWMETYKNGVFVESVDFKSTKAKMKAILKYYEVHGND